MSLHLSPILGHFCIETGHRHAEPHPDGRFLTRCTVSSGEAVRVAMANRLELAGVGCRSRLMRTSLKRLVELTDEFCC